MIVRQPKPAFSSCGPPESGPRRSYARSAARIAASAVLAAFACVWPGFAPVASAAPVTIPTAVADAIKGNGQGLCVANAISTTPSIDFPQMAGVFNAGVNAFMEAHPRPDRVEYVLRTIFDLSNNQDTGPKISWGDFTDVMPPTCQTGGCDFFKNDTTTSFGSRLRGFLNVTTALANKPLHLGFYADDAVSLTIYDKTGAAYSIMTQPPVLGAPTWRLTETVTFSETGLYPIEILFVQIVEHAALEMSYFAGDFTDFQQPANLVPDGGTIISLKDAGFTLFPPASFFQTLSGSPSYPDLDTCQQCDRQFVGHIGNNGCDPGYYCNEAALCAPCDTSIFCGPTCSPCGGMTPFCINSNGKLECANCRTDLDCQEGKSCDPILHVCQECNVDSDCPRGKECVAHSCEWCNSPDKCAGNSCNCCPKGQNGKQMMCKPLDASDASARPECLECLQDSDCSDGLVCDKTVGQCLPQSELPKSDTEQPTSCGDLHLNCTCCYDGVQNGCTDCPNNIPFSLCLPGPFGTACAHCRQDMQCGADSSFCRAGDCTPCLADRRCGKRCTSCGGDTPYCLSAQQVEDASCVRCNTDDECAAGTCDPKLHTCTASCEMTCAPETPYCDGKACVECYADTQCPCNGTCDFLSHTCSTSCKNNGDCQGDQHCHHDESGAGKVCSPGPLPDNADCGSTLADICSGTNSIGSRGRDPAPPSGALALGVMAYLIRRRNRNKSAKMGGRA